MTETPAPAWRPRRLKEETFRADSRLAASPHASRILLSRRVRQRLSGQTPIASLTASS